MTAEIGIINRSAVTLATDSAVTLTVRGSEKIYNSADKLFELSEKDPIGVMIYNNLEFMGIALEVAIKSFRAMSKHYETVALAVQAFFQYLEADLAPDRGLQQQYAKSVLYPVLHGMRLKFEEIVRRQLETQKPETIDFPAIFTESAKKHIEQAEQYSVCASLEAVTELEIAEFYGSVFDELLKELFGTLPLGGALKDLVRRLATLHIHREIDSDSVTGFVFAGFGGQETFPHLIAYRVDGVVCNRLKLRETDNVATSRSEATGKIIPFAQREMVDRFLFGIDPELEGVIEDYLSAAVGQTGTEIAKNLPRGTRVATRAKLANAARAATEAAVSQWRHKMVPLFKERFVREVQDMILLMPKQELAALAQELINLTSVKRRFSSGKDSVGGPIDVAVISRMDGFVWVRRKHYFEPGLNPRFFQRKFANPKLGGSL